MEVDANPDDVYTLVVAYRRFERLAREAHDHADFNKAIGIAD